MVALDGAADVLRLISADPWRMDALRAVHHLGLPDCWVGAGFVRALVWDHLHGFDAATPLDDVDVIYFDAGNTEQSDERRHEECLAALCPQVPWSVKNQARMHQRNGDKPYRGTSDALCHWLETPTAVAVRMADQERLELLAPLGLDDLLAMRIAPTPHALSRRLAAYRERVRAKPWARQWPQIEIYVPD
jgi:hypothetical protein